MLMREENIFWQRSDAANFWRTVAPSDHVVQIYENDAIFLDALAGFTGGGINAGDCVIVIGTKAHLKALEDKLRSYGVHVDVLVSENRYIALDAEETLSRFMVNEWPDEELFMQTVSAIMAKAQRNNRHVRAFGEMVALLLAKGQKRATVQLEHLWNKFCEHASFCLFCAYPKSAFAQDLNNSMLHICGTHTKMIRGTEESLKEVYYTC